MIHITADSWRWVMVAGAMPAFLTFFIRLFVPESERWKESVSGQVSRPLQEIFSPALLKSTLLAVAFASIALIGTWGSVQWVPLWADQMTGGTVPTAKAMTGVVSSIGAIIGCLVGPIVGGYIGRRPTYFLLCLLSLVLCGFLFRRVDAYGPEFLTVVGLVGAVTASFYGWLPLYLPELFPTRVRATGQGLSFNFGRILAAVGALQMGNLMSYYKQSYAQAGATVTLVYALGLVLIWLAPETKGRPLPE
jgi:MFS family permease